MTLTSFKSGVLAHDEILDHLHRGELFQNSSWDAKNLRAAAYDLRIADDLMIVPDRGHPSGRRYKRGDKRKQPVILRPGEVAFFSTAERICMPWNVSANIGIKFGYARRGILILTGLLVDPGFGMRRDGDSWVAKQDERLHFLVANVGPNEIVLTPGKEKIASIQFLYVLGNALRTEVISTADMDREFFDANDVPKLGLSFFEDMTNLRDQFVEFRKRFETVESGSKQIVMFGVYLLTATILVAAFVTLLSIVASDDLAGKLKTISDIAPKTWKGVASLVGGGLAVGFIVNSFRKLLEFLVDRSFRGYWSNHLR
jgi:deoxycytidine triphosphate deaminase